jgi:DNA helicase-2/ATP-dependent DNA helicase PcrA
LVIAGAGSGKTRVIEHRVLHLIEQGVAPAHILLLTFTRRAAKEMLTRAAARDPRAAQVDGGTFHGFAVRILRQYAATLRLPPGFTVMDQEDATTAVGRCMSRTQATQTVERFPSKKAVLDILSAVVNRRLSIPELLQEEYPQFQMHADALERVRRAYVQFKLDSGCLDFDDLLTFLLILLRQPAVQDQLAERYRFVMVDEYQDTNAIQGDIVCALAEKHGNVLIVGDDAQSIYRFRGACRQNILTFPQRFPGCRVVKLELNYRSSQPILDVANAVLKNMTTKFGKTLRSATGTDGARPMLLHFLNDYAEAEWIADAIKQARDEGVPLNDHAVLYRAGYLSNTLQIALAARQIPFVVYGGLKLSEAAHIKDLIAHLRLLGNPRDAIAWSRVLELFEGIGPRIGDRLASAVGSAATLEAACAAVTAEAAKTPKLKKPVAKLTEALQRSNRTPSVGEKIDIILVHYRPLLELKYDDWHRRLDDLEGLRSSTARYTCLDDLVADLSLDPPSQSKQASAGACSDEPPLVLSTIHSAKGLEFGHVYVLGLMDGVIPSAWSLAHPEALEEESRLVYVAVTRAKRQLVLTMHNGGWDEPTLARVSRFLQPSNVQGLLDGCPEPIRVSANRSHPPVPQLSKDELLAQLLCAQPYPVISGHSENGD